MAATSACSAFMRAQANGIYLNLVVLGELLAGFAKSGREGRMREAVKASLTSLRVDIVGVDDETAERYAVIVELL